MNEEFTFKGIDQPRAVARLALIQLDRDKTYKITLKEDKAKKSLSANGYAWALLDKLAEKTHIAKTEIYRRLVKEIGGNSELVCVQDKAVDALCEYWSRLGIGWQTETEKSKIQGCTNVRLYKGSSEYDTAQMSRLIDLIVQECKQQGIETMTPQEIAALMEVQTNEN